MQGRNTEVRREIREPRVGASPLQAQFNTSKSPFSGNQKLVNNYQNKVKKADSSSSKGFTIVLNAKNSPNHAQGVSKTAKNPKILNQVFGSRNPRNATNASSEHHGGHNELHRMSENQGRFKNTKLQNISGLKAQTPLMKIPTFNGPSAPTPSGRRRNGRQGGVSQSSSPLDQNFRGRKKNGRRADFGGNEGVSGVKGAQTRHNRAQNVREHGLGAKKRYSGVRSGGVKFRSPLMVQTQNGYNMAERRRQHAPSISNQAVDQIINRVSQVL